MIEIKKMHINEMETYDVSICNENKVLQILFGGNLDLAWNIYDKNKHSTVKINSIEEIEITKENYFIYSLFEKLFNDIKNCNISQDFTGLQSNLAERKNGLKTKDVYKKLFHNDYIEWYSDGSCEEEANIVKINKVNEKFVISFKKRNEDISLSGYQVCFSNSGSKYAPFNVIFMRMYNELLKYDPDYQQIYIEEYMYQKTLKK